MSGLSQGEGLWPLEKRQLHCGEREVEGCLLGGFDFTQLWGEPQKNLDNRDETAEEQLAVIQEKLQRSGWDMCKHSRNLKNSWGTIRENSYILARL